MLHDLHVCLLIAAAAPALGVLPAVCAALAGCAATGRLTWRSVPIPLALMPAR